MPRVSTAMIMPGGQPCKDVPSSRMVLPHVTTLGPMDVAAAAQIDGAQYQELLQCNLAGQSLVAVAPRFSRPHLTLEEFGHGEAIIIDFWFHFECKHCKWMETFGTVLMDSDGLRICPFWRHPKVFNHHRCCQGQERVPVVKALLQMPPA